MSCKYLLIYTCFALSLFHNAWFSCVFHKGKYDLSSLDWPGGWTIPGPVTNDSNTRYVISLCRALNYTSSPSVTGCVNSSVCQITGNDSVSFGDFSTDLAIADIGRDFTIFFHTNTKCESNEIYRAAMHFTCGPHLGFPEVYLRSKCQVYIMWRTSAACPTKPKVPQVPCYALDESGEKRDLSHLIKLAGGYHVSTPDLFVDFWINVCSGITPDEATKNCPDGSSACRVVGSEYLSFGTAREPLKLTKEGLLLTYTVNETETKMPAGCSRLPKTTILFKCPERGYSHLPRVIFDSNCQYEVEWETEYACPESLLKGNLKTCQFSRDQHGVDIDLSPLSKKTYAVRSRTSNTTQFDIGVCGGLGAPYKCGSSVWKSIAACMVNTTSPQSGVSVGSTSGSTFIYADDHVTLTYPNGLSCEDGMTHSTVINFICSTNGTSEPHHVSSDHCVHFFEWPTEHACLKHDLDIPCSVRAGKKKISLQNLFLVEGGAWEAVDRRNVPGPGKAEYYINVCGQVSGLGNLSKCGESSSACVLQADGSYLNLGNFVSPPLYDNGSNSVTLEYTGGSPCKNETLWRSTVRFICLPGHMNSEPVLTRINEKECIYQFEWQTAEACPEGVIQGSDCKVIDNNLGIYYDLNPLKSKTYEVDTELFKFYVGVCEPVVDSPCSKNANSTGNVGVCLVDKDQQKSWKAGESSSNLSYADGVVNLTYMSGDPYPELSNTSRMTIIIFICNHEADNGRPYFVEKLDSAYVFHWYTNLVCPSYEATECLVHDPDSHLIYDLSGLASYSDNYGVVITEDAFGFERRVFLNVCRSLKMTDPIADCDPKASACVLNYANDEVLVSNIGRFTSPPIFEGTGHITLTYTQGDYCTSYGKNTTYTTVIHFVCDTDPDYGQNYPTFLNKLGNCEYVFLWSTPAACPTSNLLAKETCELTDPNSGFTFDLTPLRQGKKPYSVQGPSGTFQFNVCGKIVEGCTHKQGKTAPSQNISVCEVDSEGYMTSEIASATSFFLTYSVGQDLTLTYTSDINATQTDQQVSIKLPCYNGTVDPKPKFIRQEGNRYIIEMPTRLTCIPSHFECNIVDSKGNEYDLNLLSRFSGYNWEVGDPKPRRSHIRYHINFCRPLVRTGTYRCPGGASAACMTSTAEKEAPGHDLGFQISPPTVTDRGTILVRYSNGSYCDRLIKLSTTIELFCSDTQGDMTFLGETPECEYLFSLNTPAACPIRSVRGDDCKVKDPVFGYQFDLSPLKSKMNNYNMSDKEFLYSFNVCGKLNGFDSSNCANSSACQTKPGSPEFSKSLGLPSEKLVYQKGVITLEYQSGTGSCHGKYNRSSKITFTCHHGNENKDGPKFVTEADDCTYLFEWSTVHACPPFDVMECAVVDDHGITYDFSKLSLPDDNYYVKNRLDNSTFVLNLCRSVVHSSNSICPYTAASCLVDNLDKKMSVNLGKAHRPPYIEDGRIKVKYSTGDVCSDGKPHSEQFWETVIEFVCDPRNVESEPEYIGKDDCTYHFDWATAYACPLKPVELTDDCTVADPNSGFLYNLTSLQSQLFQVPVNNHKYYLSICSNLTSINCAAGLAGMCQEELTGKQRAWSGGEFNRKLHFSNGFLFLNYSNGDSCHNGLFQRNTIIEFHCGVGMGEPKFEHEAQNCTYFFSWKTELACQKKMHCVIENGSQTIDLSNLARSYFTASSSIANDDSLYYVSVCGALPRIDGAYCPAGTSICKVEKQQNKTRSLSLGKAEIPPFIDFMHHATALYTNGTVCDNSEDVNHRARIVFICDSNAGIGEPVVVDIYETCVYLFEWRTSLVCPDEPQEENVTSCTYTDESKGFHFDLSPLQRTFKPYQVPNERDGGQYLLQICSSLGPSNISNCEASGVCATGTNTALNYGLASSQQFSYDGRRLKLAYTGGDACPSGENGKLSSVVLFVCDPSAGYGGPVLHKRYTCLLVFLWKTSLVCTNLQQQCSFNIGGSHYDLNLLTSLSHNWEATYDKNTYFINICRGIQKTAATAGCSPSAAICMVNQEGDYITLGTIYSMEAKIITSSGDTDLMLNFTTTDTRACAGKSSGPLSPTVRIFMRCGDSLGSPKIHNQSDSKCFYDFLWESSLACREKAEIIMLEKNGIIQDPRFNFTVNITDILNRTFSVPGTTGSDEYIYQINLSGGHANATDYQSTCSQSAVCQTKPSSKFYRDIGSYDTRTFIIRGNELHLNFTSRTKPCGKNGSKNVTTLINLHCSHSAGIGTPKFMHESGECDYVFEWDTIAVCPDYHWSKDDDGGSKEHNIKPDHYQDVQTSHKAEIIVGVMFLFIVLIVVVFIMSKPQRRAIVSHRIRGIFGRVNLPYFRYKRFNGDRLVLVDASQPHYDDDRDVEMLT